jgi:hypothetical protein
MKMAQPLFLKPKPDLLGQKTDPACLVGLKMAGI